MNGKKTRVIFGKNKIEIAKAIRHRIPVFGESDPFGPDLRVQSVYLAEGTCNGDAFGAVAIATEVLDPKVTMYGPVAFERHERSSLGMRLMILRPETVETVFHPEAETEEQAMELVARLTEEGRAAYVGERILLEVPFKDKDEAKARGARWSQEEKRWYVMSKLVDLDDFGDWISDRAEMGETPSP